MTNTRQHTKDHTRIWVDEFFNSPVPEKAVTMASVGLRYYRAYVKGTVSQWAMCVRFGKDWPAPVNPAYSIDHNYQVLLGRDAWKASDYGL